MSLIKSLREPYELVKRAASNTLEERIHGAWMGRVVGCLLGKAVEGIRTDELVPFLKGSNNYPMHRYIRSTDITDEVCEKYKFRFASRCYADTADGMPVDDDTNYTVLAQLLIDQCSREFTSYDSHVLG